MVLKETPDLGRSCVVFGEVSHPTGHQSNLELAGGLHPLFFSLWSLQQQVPFS